MLIAAVAIGGSSAFLVAQRLTQRGEPGFIRATEPPFATRVWSFSESGTTATTYGATKPFNETLMYYTDALASRGYLLRPSTDAVRVFDGASGECVTLEEFKDSSLGPRASALLKIIKTYPFAFDLTWSDECRS
jgi:hypothetical protein